MDEVLRTIAALAIALAITWRLPGSYMAAAYDGRVRFLGFAERPIYQALGTNPEHEQTLKRYAESLVIFSAVRMGATCLILRIQGSVPLNPQHRDADTAPAAVNVTLRSSCPSGHRRWPAGAVSRVRFRRVSSRSALYSSALRSLVSILSSPVSGLRWSIS